MGTCNRGLWMHIDKTQLKLHLPLEHDAWIYGMYTIVSTPQLPHQSMVLLVVLVLVMLLVLASN